MSVLIKGMEMPKNCNECRFSVDGWCYVCAPQSEEERKRITSNYCPLVPVPPHGRLIDIEPFMRGLYEEIQVGEITYTSQEIYDMMDNEIKSMPTIIEAEEAKDD